jgi:putative RNA 2'-phosphotransferase
MELSKFLKDKSRFLSLVLRHKPEAANIELDSEGYVGVSELCQSLKISFQDLEKIVVSNDKQRFAFNSDKTKIRASQGHSVKEVQLTLEKVDPPAELYHGTKEAFLASIAENGLLKGSRHHVHLSDNKETAKNVADRRKGVSVILKIDAMFMRADGIKFYKSENGVYLTDIVLPKYIISDHECFKKRKV